MSKDPVCRYLSKATIGAKRKTVSVSDRATRVRASLRRYALRRGRRAPSSIQVIAIPIGHSARSAAVSRGAQPPQYNPRRTATVNLLCAISTEHSRPENDHIERQPTVVGYHCFAQSAEPSNVGCVLASLLPAALTIRLTGQSLWQPGGVKCPYLGMVALAFSSDCGL